MRTTYHSLDRFIVISFNHHQSSYTLQCTMGHVAFHLGNKYAPRYVPRQISMELAGTRTYRFRTRTRFDLHDHGRNTDTRHQLKARTVQALKRLCS